MLIAPSVVVADDMVPDGDGGTASLGTLNFGSVCVGETYSRDIAVYIQRAWPASTPTDQSRTFNGGAPGVTITLASPATDHADLAATIPSDGSVVLPSDWRTNTTTWFNGAIYTGDTATVRVVLTPSAAGTPATARTVNATATGLGGNSGTSTVTRTIQDLKVTWSAAACNSAPSTPGKPAPTPASPNQGGFTLNWTASTDDGQPNPPSAVTYALEGKRLAESFASVASGITTNSYSFTSGNPAEGTWTYRVRASDSALTSAYSADSDPVVVDRTNPTLGTCPAGGPYLLNSGGGSQSVGPIGVTDGNLPDGSAGSGVNAGASTLSGTVDTTSVGNKSVSFTAVDNAGNSAQKSCSYSVAYGFAGFFSPVDNSPVLNKAKAGQAIPLKWRLTDANGDPVLSLSSVSVTATSLTCSLGTTADAVEEYATGSSGLQNLGDGYYQFNWATPKSYANSCKTASLNLGDGSSRTALFQFTK